MKKYDLIVVGGGFSGTAAAIAAARGGARVLLVDKSNCLGGAASNCLVNPFTRFSTTIDGEKVFLVAGIFKEIRSRLEARGAMMKALFLEEELKVILNDDDLITYELMERYNQISNEFKHHYEDYSDFIDMHHHKFHLLKQLLPRTCVWRKF